MFICSPRDQRIRTHSFKQRNPSRPEESRSSVQRTSSQNISRSTLFLSLVNYCSCYVEDYSTTTYPPRQLLKEKTNFHWGEKQQKSFLKLKQAITSAPILAHFSISASTRVVVDASPWALGAVFLQQSDSTYRPTS